MTSGRTYRCSWLITAVLFLLLSLALGMPNSPSSGEVFQADESCGINMECVPRKLCQDSIYQDDGFTLIAPMIGQTKCSRVLWRCCHVKQKEDKSQAQSLQSS